jgi:UDP-glucuronate decarboxylase
MNYILVTGSAGFIGTHLCERLLENNANVIGLDNYITGFSRNTLYLLQKYPNYKFYECNIINKNELNFLNDINITEIYHLASLASPDKYQEFPLETMDVNIIGTINLLNLAKQKNSKLLFTSTSEVYGDPLIHPQPESYYGNVNTVGIRSCYDESKRAGETYVDLFKRIHKSNNYKIVRIFNTYGPFMDINDGRVITNFIKCIINNEPIKIYGDGMQTRSFCYISDMVSGLIQMMNSSESGPINIGNPNCEFDLIELKNLFEEILDKKIDIIYLDKQENDPKVRKPVITLASDRLNFEPKVNLKEGLILTYNYFNDLKKIQ